MSFQSLIGHPKKLVIKGDKVQSLKTIRCSQLEECVKEGNATDLPHIEDKPVIVVNKAGLATKVSQRDDGGQLLKAIVKEERKEDDIDQHCDEVLERCQKEIELLEYLLEEPEYRSEIAVCDRECLQVSDSEKMFQTLVGTKMYNSFHTNDMVVGTREGEIDEYDVAIKEIEYKLLLGSKVKVQGQQKILKREMSLRALRKKRRQKITNNLTVNVRKMSRKEISCNLILLR